MEFHEIHQAQISRFAAFMKSKQELGLAQREGDKDEFIMDRLPDPAAIYNAADVQTLLLAYHAQVMMRYQEEFEKVGNITSVYTAQLFHQAQVNGVVLQVDDISVCEDQSLAGQMATLAAMNAAPLMRRGGTLDALGSGGGGDPVMAQELNDMKEENRQMKDRNLKMQTEMSSMLKERSALAGELEQVKANLKQHLNRMHEQSGAIDSASAMEYERQLAEVRALHDQKHAEVEGYRRDMNQRLGDSAQFRQLNAIVKQKSDQVKELRQRLVAAGLSPHDEGGDHIELQAEDD